MGKFDFFKSIGATKQAVAVLNDQPQLFTTMILVIIGLSLEAGLIALIHFMTLKPSQKKKKAKPGDKKGGAKDAGKPRGDNPRR